MPGISLVVATYDADAKLDRCIGSFIKTHAGKVPFEIIISLDGGPNGDRAQDIADRHGVKLARLKENSGCAFANNNGIRTASENSECVVVANDDVWFDEDTCAKIHAYMMGHPRTGVVGTRLLYPDGTTQHGGFDARIVHIGRGLHGDHPLVCEDRATIAVTSALMGISRKLLDSIKGFDERYRMGFEDVDLCFKARDLGWDVHYLGSIKAYHEEGGTRGRIEKLMTHERWGGWNNLGHSVFTSLWSTSADKFCYDSITFVVSALEASKLKVTLDNINSQMSSRDEVIVVSRNDYVIEKLVSEYGQRFRYHPGLPDSGCDFDLGIKRASGCYLTFLNDGGTYLDGGVESIRKAVRENHLCPTLFKVGKDSEELWRKKIIESSDSLRPQALLVPNCPDFFTPWAAPFHDYSDPTCRFLMNALAVWKEGTLVWKDVQIA